MHGHCQTSNQCASSRGLKGIRCMKIYRRRRLDSRADPDLEQFQRIINPRPAARGNHSCGRPRHLLRHIGTRPDRACGKFQATVQLPCAPVLRRGAHIQPFTERLPSDRDGLPKIAQERLRIKAACRSKPHRVPQRSMGVVVLRGGNLEADRSPRQHSDFIPNVLIGLEPLGPVLRCQHVSWHGLDLSHPARHHVGDGSSHAFNRVPRPHLRNDVNLRGENEVVDQNPAVAVMRADQPPSNVLRQRPVHEEVAPAGSLPTKAPRLLLGFRLPGDRKFAAHGLLTFRREETSAHKASETGKACDLRTYRCAKARDRSLPNIDSCGAAADSHATRGPSCCDAPVSSAPNARASTCGAVDSRPLRRYLEAARKQSRPGNSFPQLKGVQHGQDLANAGNGSRRPR